MTGMLTKQINYSNMVEYLEDLYNHRTTDVSLIGLFDSSNNPAHSSLVLHTANISSTISNWETHYVLDHTGCQKELWIKTCYPGQITTVSLPDGAAAVIDVDVYHIIEHHKKYPSDKRGLSILDHEHSRKETHRK